MTPYPAWIPRQVDSLLMNGLAPKQIKAQIPAVDGGYISARVRKLGIPKFPRGRPISQNSVEAGQMLEGGCSPKQIKAALEISGATITKLSKKFGLPLWQVGRPPKPTSEPLKVGRGALVRLGEIIGRVVAGESKSSIARSLGVTRQRVDQILEPRKHKARCSVRSALKAGELVRPARCSRCLRSDREIQAHHADYHKPLEVTWVCPPCHGELYTKI